LARGRPQVLLDSSVIPLLRRDPTLGGRIAANEEAVVSFITRPELRNAVAQGRGLRCVPRALDDLAVLGTRPSLDTSINLRGLLAPGRGRFGDGIVGGQALDLRIPLITDDAELAAAVRALGGVVR
jgi:predicted nucleic acid-binding protein